VINKENQFRKSSSGAAPVSASSGALPSFANQVQELKQSLEKSLDQQIASLMAEADVRTQMEAKIAELTATEAELREELESATDRADEQKLQLKRLTKEKGLDRAHATKRYETLEAESRAEIEKLKNQLTIAVQEKDEFSEFFQYTEKSLKEKIATLEAEKTKALAQFAEQENESRRKLASMADEKWGLELQVTQLTKDLENRGNEVEMGELRSQILKAQADLKKCQIALDEAQERIEEFAEVEQASCAEIVRLTDLLARANENEERLRESNQTIGREKAKFEAHTLRLTQELARAETSAWDSEEALEKATAELAQAQTDLNRAMLDLGRARANHEKMSEAHRAERDQLLQNQVSGTQSQARIQRLTEDLAKALGVIADCEDRIERLVKDREPRSASL
jgi:chromosome segregation ATPase